MNYGVYTDVSPVYSPKQHLGTIILTVINISINKNIMVQRLRKYNTILINVVL